MRRLILLVSLLICTQAARTQNLVLNPGFEQYRYCRDNSLYRAQFWFNWSHLTGLPSFGTGALGWYSPTLFSNSSPTQPSKHVLACNKGVFLPVQALALNSFTYDSSWYLPRNGQAYALIHTRYNSEVGPLAFHDAARTYLQAELAAPLRAGCTYRVTFYARLAWGLEFTTHIAPPIATDNLGAYFSDQPIIQSPAAPFIIAQPQVSSPPGVLITDTVGYTRVSGTFVAQGNERFLTLGNFRPDAATTTRQLWHSSRFGGASRYAIDDVSVEAVPPPGLALNLGPDLWLGSCANAATTIAAGPGFQSYRWNTGQTTASISVSQPGRYVVTADFGCGVVKDSVEVRRFDPARTPLLGLAAPPAPLCPGESVSISARAGFQQYQWADGPTGPVRTLTQPGRYRLSARTADGCLVQDSVLITALAPPSAPRLPADTLLCADALPLRLPVPPPPAAGLRYEWSAPGATATALPVAAAGTYTLTVRNRCLASTATVRVRVQDCAPLFPLPNIISPNGDGLNDYFQVRAATERPLVLRVFDRWGREVYRADQYRNDWPQRPPAAGLYYYLLTDTRYQRSYRGWLEVMP
ncbi:hypothetical protein GCM10023185_09750 [Hymenobacter saemangeumensis]|uniref:Gliding motility-associated C-terminal domain-containing protein n=1 Tax=Hymenobacter saemangeumensis TaxID=1084522 RepID=A0ABP8I4J9_9BACT